MGAPYRKTKYFKIVRQQGIVCGVWSLSFAIKYVYTVLGMDLVSIDENAGKHRPVIEDFRSAVLLAVQSILTELIPLYMVIEPDFVKNFNMEFL